MAIKGLAFNEQNEYITKDDAAQTRADGATIFTWNAVPSKVIARVSDNSTQAEMQFAEGAKQVIINKAAQRNRECFRFGVSNIENFLDPKTGALIPFVTDNIMEGGTTYKVVAEIVLQRIPLSVINEVGGMIFNQSVQTDQQRKNSEALLSRLGVSSTSSAPTATTDKNANAAAPNPPTGASKEPIPGELVEAPVQE